MRRWARLGLVAATVALQLFGGMLAALHAAISHGALTAEVDAALERAIGRAVTHDEVSVRPGFRPRIALLDATIANIDGGSAPDFARICRLEVTLALLPLLSRQVEIHGLLVADADILLERDAEGRANWVFGRDAAAAPSRGIRIAALAIESARIRLPGAPVHRIEIASLTMARDAPEDPVSLVGRVRLNGEALSLQASLGAEVDGALPLSAKVTGDGLRLGLRGTWPRGTDQPAWSLALDMQAERGTMERLARSFGQRDLPLAPGPVDVTARPGPGAPFPAVSDLTVKVGATDARAIVPGLSLTRAELRASTFEAPVRVSAQGRWLGAELGLRIALPSPRTMLEAPVEAPWPVEGTITTGRSRLTLAGGVRRDQALDATQFEARLVTPDLARLGQVFGAALPRLTGVTASARLSGLSSRELQLAALSVTSQALEAQGNLAIGVASRPSLLGQLTMRRLDLDAIGGHCQLGGSWPCRGGRARMAG